MSFSSRRETGLRSRLDGSPPRTISHMKQILAVPRKEDDKPALSGSTVERALALFNAFLAGLMLLGVGSLVVLLVLIFVGGNHGGVPNAGGGMGGVMIGMLLVGLLTSLAISLVVAVPLSIWLLLMARW